MLRRVAARVSGAMAISVFALVATRAGNVVPDFPPPPSDPATAARGKQIFGVNCSFCHGSDGRGGEGGPNLLRSPVVLNDQKGNLIATVVQTGRVEKGMPKFDLSADSIADIAAYLHSIPLGRAEGQALDPKAILVGDAVATEGEVRSGDLILMKMQYARWASHIKANMQRAQVLGNARGLYHKNDPSPDVFSDEAPVRASVAQEGFSRNAAKPFIPGNPDQLVDGANLADARKTVNEIRTKIQNEGGNR